MLAFIFVGGASIWLNDLSIFVSFFTLWIIGFLFTGASRQIYFFSFALYCLFSFVIALSFFVDHGDYFAGGGDDEFFYIFAMEVYKYGLADYYNSGEGVMNYKGFILFISLWVSFLQLFVEKDIFHFGLLFLNCALGAATIVLLYRIGQKIFVTQRLSFTLGNVFLVAAFPLTLYYSSVLLRDCWITFLFTLNIYLNIRYQKFLKRVLFSALVIAVCYFIRPISAFFLIIFTVTYSFYSSSRPQKIILFFMVSAMAYILMINPTLIVKGGSVQNITEYYAELSADYSDKNSIGSLLVQSTNPFMKPVVIIYLFFSPIPPPVVLKGNIHNAVRSIGSVIWYFILPLVTIAFFKAWLPKANKVVPAFFITTAIAGVVIAFTSMEPRHLQFIYPFFIILFMLLCKTHPKIVAMAFKYYLIAIIFMAIGYIIIKNYFL